MSIALDQVTKRYQGLPVVNDVSLDVAEGEFLVLLGPSGSGKSTLLRAIAGLTGIDHGTIALHGRDVTRVSARQREVGLVFQHYALFRHMTVAENIEFALRVRRVKSAERRKRRRELLKLVALEGMDDRLPTQLSGGQQQRVAVARALAHRPKVLLMDEPFGALDAKIREELRRTIRAVQRELRMTTILVTHDQEEAFALADRIGVMNQGRLLECGRPDDLYARPATRFVATFLGAANLLLGYPTPKGVRFTARAAEAAGAGSPVQPPREVVAVLRPEEVELAAGEGSLEANYVGHGHIEELLFAGAVERLRVRMPENGPVAASPGRDPGMDAAGSLLEVSRTIPEQREFPVVAGQKVAVGARRIHVLPTPISSFTIIAADDSVAARLRDSALLTTLASRMHTRVSTTFAPRPWNEADDRRELRRAPPGMPVIETGPGSAASADWLLRHGALQLLCIPPASPLPRHVVIHAQGDDVHDQTMAVAASLLRHVPAEASLFGSRPLEAPEAERGGYMQLLTDLRKAARGQQNVPVKAAELSGAPEEQLAQQLALLPDSMLVLGISRADEFGRARLQRLLETEPVRPLLIVRPFGAYETQGS
ncbi:MAG: ATP-binding cassette domain-containing protein [Gammaproteobacteria bacterium]|nr:ATP-binding cassette domain-containing protein [Gammaproteobacteria bacterium]